MPVKNNYCVDCGALIWSNAERCQPCAMGNPERGRKISKALKGRKFSLKHRQNIGKAKKGWSPPLEWRQKKSENMQRRWQSPEYQREMSEAMQGEKNPNWGKSHSSETRQKMSEAKQGKYEGENNPAWTGGRRETKGYVYIYTPDHPRATKHGCVLEHRLVMEEHLGRYLELWELVHHKNGIKDDNRVENLELVPGKGAHMRITLATNAQIKMLEAKVKEWQKAYFGLLTGLDRIDTPNRGRR